MADYVYIFDTTLRDGEQSPGCSMNVREKLQVARMLDELGVDVIEAGFPAASDGDFESVKAVGDLGLKATICGLSRTRHGDIDAVARSLDTAKKQAPAHFHRDQPDPPRIQAEDEQAADHRRDVRRHGVRQAVVRRHRGHRRGCRPHRDRLPDRVLPGSHRRRRARAERAGYRGLRDAQRKPPAVPAPHRQPAPRRQRDPELPQPQRPGPGRGQRPGRHRGRRAAGGMHHQRHRRARRQLLAGRSGHGAAHPARPLRTAHRHRHHQAVPGQPRGHAPSPAHACSRTRPSSAAMPSPTRPAFTRTACSSTRRPTRS